MENIRLLVADDHAFYREGVKSMLNGKAGVTVIGEAASGDEAVAAALSVRPDVVLMDLKMPGLNGIEATRKILAREPQARILVLTMFDDESVFAAIRAGARGYLLKDATVDDLLRAVTAVHRGEAIFSPASAEKLMRYFAQTRVNTTAFPALTEREHDVLLLIAQGHSNTEIAELLSLTHKTVRNYVSNIFDKLQVADRAHAIVKARDAGFS